MRRFVLVFALLAAASTLARAQQPQQPRNPPQDPLAPHVFPPELVMEYQRAIGLQENQRAGIMAEMQKAQSKFMDVQWRIHGEAEKLQQLLAAPRVDEAAVLAQVDRILELEREIKKTQLLLIIRIKNTLSQEQQEKLTVLRKGGPH